MSFLNNDLREQMIKELVKHGFEAAKTAALELVKEQGDKVYAHIFAKHLEAINSLPENFCCCGRSFKIAINGQHREIMMTENKRLPYECSKRWSNCIALFSEDELPEVIKQYLKVDEAFDTLVAASNNAESQARNALYSVRTFKKLWEVWPECKSILGQFEIAKDGKVYLPSVPVQQLNTAFGLPVEAVAHE